MEYAGLFIAAFLAATVLPVASELPLALVVRSSGAVVWPVVVATAGNYLGACTTYALARAAVRRFAPTAEFRSPLAIATVRRYGAPALLLSWVPFLGDAIVAVAGAASMPFLPFSIWTAVGKAVRYGVVAWASRP
jgi:membrane protein YqaA with SNARE-associated domain